MFIACSTVPPDVKAVAFLHRFSDGGAKPVPAADLAKLPAVPLPDDDPAVVTCSVSLDHINKVSRCAFDQEIKLDGDDAVTTIKSHLAVAAGVSDLSASAAHAIGFTLRDKCDKRDSIFCPSS